MTIRFSLKQSRQGLISAFMIYLMFCFYRASSNFHSVRQTSSSWWWEHHCHLYGWWWIPTYQ